MPLSNRTIALLAGCFAGGGGPSHSTIDLVFTAADAADYLSRAEGNKLDRVLYVLRYLRDGAPQRGGDGPLPPAPDRLLVAVADLENHALQWQ